MLESLPSPLVPATVEDRGGTGTAISHAAEGMGGVVFPSRVRLREDMWVSSQTFYVLDAEVRYMILVCRYEVYLFFRSRCMVYFVRTYEVLRSTLYV